MDGVVPGHVKKLMIKFSYKSLGESKHIARAIMLETKMKSMGLSAVTLSNTESQYVVHCETI
jgi:hypothetical protein